ncbi:MAG: glycerol-3-phosphate dehydrogenase/oxidase [Methylohalobius crimeensis]
MNRSATLERLRSETAPWDVVVIGGGATGLGVAVDAASRGYRTALLEQHDFAKGTSSRSTKLIHGGVRYLRQGDIQLVRESLQERAVLMANAPHLVTPLGFVMPAYRWWQQAYYAAGLKLYDLLAGRRNIAPSRRLSRLETLDYLPTLQPSRLRGGVLYFDAQFDDARLAVTLARTATDRGAAVVNYTRVTGLRKANGRIKGVDAVDEETGETFAIPAKTVVNATGVFSDTVRRLDDPRARPMIAPSRGVHLVLPKRYLPGKKALLIPRTDDGRVLFAIPWQDRVVVGTTDVPVKRPSLEPAPSRQEGEYLLTHARRYLTNPPTESDVLSTFAGLRPLVKADGNTSPAALSRDHTLRASPSGLVTIAGGKWTTYRRMARDTVNRLIELGPLPQARCVTKKLRLHGCTDRPLPEGHWREYGADADAIRQLIETPDKETLLHPHLPYRLAEVRWAVRFEMARTVEDVLTRRTRALLLDARASIEAAPMVARVMAEELNRDAAWIQAQIQAFQRLAKSYLIVPIRSRPKTD